MRIEEIKHKKTRDSIKRYDLLDQLPMIKDIVELRRIFRKRKNDWQNHQLTNSEYYKKYYEDHAEKMKQSAKNNYLLTRKHQKEAAALFKKLPNV